MEADLDAIMGRLFSLDGLLVLCGLYVYGWWAASADARKWLNFWEWWKR